MPTQVRPKNVADQACHEGQPHGHGIGVDQNMAEHLKSSTMGPVNATNKPLSGAGIFKARGPVLRNSGHPGAHRIGGKKK